MEHRRGGNLREELHRPILSSCATHFAKKPPPLRIVVPPTEYCPFSTDLTLPITPLSLPTPVSSSWFTFSDTQELVDQSIPPMPAPVLCTGVAAAAEVASPTSSQFLLMPPTPHLEIVDSETTISAPPPPPTSVTAKVLIDGGFNGTKSANLRPWEVSSSTWLSDLGGHTETDRIFRRNLLEVTSVDTESSPASTPELSPSGVSPASQVSSVLAHTALATSPASLPPALSQHPCIMSPQSSSLPPLVLGPTGTDTFPSTLDSLQAWRESVTPGLPRSEEPPSPLSEDIHGSQLASATLVYPSLPSHQLPSHSLSPRVPRVSKSQVFIKRAKMFGGRVKRLVTRQNDGKNGGTMDRGVNFNVVTSQDSENGSVILITAPPPPYDVRPMSHDLMGQDVRSHTVSEYSSAVQTSTIELATTGMTESGPRQGGSRRNTLRRLSFAALSTIKRF